MDCPESRALEQSGKQAIVDLDPFWKRANKYFHKASILPKSPLHRGAV